MGHSVGYWSPTGLCVTDHKPQNLTTQSLNQFLMYFPSILHEFSYQPLQETVLTSLAGIPADTIYFSPFIY